jgi:hypothetical protein
VWFIIYLDEVDNSNTDKILIKEAIQNKKGVLIFLIIIGMARSYLNVTGACIPALSSEIRK